MRYAFARAAGAAVLLALSTAAQADGTYKDAPVADAPVAQAKWTGPYIALSVGYADVGTDLTHTLDVPPLGYYRRDTQDGGAETATGTIAVGYDRELGNSIVAGVFVDYTFGDFEGSVINFTPTSSSIFQTDTENFWAVGARLGLTRADTLWFVNAGYTEADFTVSSGGQSIERDLDGYFVGAGLERIIHPNLALKLEYRYSDYDETNVAYTVTTVCGGVCTERSDVESDMHAIRLGLVWRLDTGREEIPHEPLK